MGCGITVEVPLLLSFFLFFPYSLGYNKSECALLGTIYNNETEKLESLVEPQATLINMVRSTMETLFAVLLCLFIGPWSDRFGRKPILIVNMLGSVIGSFGVSVFSYFENLSPWYSLLCAVPGILSGGGASYLTVILAYITDISSEENRGLRMAIFEGVIALGILLGTVSSSYVYYATNYVTVFAISGGLFIFSVAYTMFFIPESLENREREGKLRGFFQISNVVDMAKTTIKKREHYGRAILLLSIASLTLYMFVIMGDGGLTFFYLRDKFQWTLTKYTLFSSVTNVIGIFGTVVGVIVLHKCLHASELQLLLLGCTFLLVGALLQGLGNKDWYIYAAGIIRCPGGIISPMARSFVSKLVHLDEIGKIFAMIMASETAIILTSSPLYTAVYYSTINTDPGVFNYMTAGVFLIIIILILTIIYMQKIKPSNYDQLQNGESQETSEPVYTIN